MIEPSDLPIQKKSNLASNRMELAGWLRETRSILEDLQLSIILLVQKGGILTEKETQDSYEFMSCIGNFDQQIRKYQEACKFRHE